MDFGYLASLSKDAWIVIVLAISPNICVSALMSYWTQSSLSSPVGSAAFVYFAQAVFCFRVKFFSNSSTCARFYNINNFYFAYKLIATTSFAHRCCWTLSGSSCVYRMTNTRLSSITDFTNLCSNNISQ